MEEQETEIGTGDCPSVLQTPTCLHHDVHDGIESDGTWKEVWVARLGRVQEDDVQAILLQLDTIAKSPLHAIAGQLQPLLELAARSHDLGELPSEELRMLVRYTTHVLNRLPQVFGPRFGFDAVQIAAITEDLGRNRFSGMLIPRYEQDWGHESVMMPAENGKSHVIDLILMPGQDSVREVNLLSYPWLGHELAHNLLFRHDTTFCDDVSRQLDKDVQRLKVGAIADRGTAHSKATRILEEFVRFWSPTLDHKNWAHEIAADCIALWIFGPAYLACFEDALDNTSLNPYELTQSHPPYFVRANALLVGAHLLGWNDAALRRRIAAWADSKWRDSKSNRLLSLARPELTSMCVSAALQTCQALQLAKCTRDGLNAMLGTSARRPPEFGLNLILEAYVMFEECGERAYLAWQAPAVQQLADTVTL
jgi:hypothetical protein